MWTGSNFKTRRKSYKHKKKTENPRKEWLIFENTHEPIISQHDFDLVREMRKSKRKIQKCGEVNPFSGMVYCADCGAKMYLCRSRSLTDEQEHLKCSTYASDSDKCAKQLAEVIGGRDFYVNLIPYNSTDSEFRMSDTDSISRFCGVLKENGVIATKRREFGADLKAACGQLRADHAKKL